MKWQCAPILYQPVSQRSVALQPCKRWKWDICRGKFRELFISHKFVSSRNLSLLIGCRCCVLRDSRKRVRFLFPRVARGVERGRLIRLFRSRCNAHGFFDRTSLPFRTATPTGYRGWSGLPRRFLRRYFIIQNSGHPSHFHRNGSWRGGSHWPPRAPETSSRCLIVDRPSHSSGSIARNFIAIFLVYGEHIIIMCRSEFKYLGCAKVSIVLVPRRFIFIHDGKLAQVPPWHHGTNEIRISKMESNRIWILQ